MVNFIIKGKLYTWGKNVHNCLGNPGNIFTFPTLVNH